MAKTKTTQTSHTTGSTTANTATSGTSDTQRNVPDWLLDPYQRQAGQIGGLLDQGPDAFAPVTSDLQNRAFDAAGNLRTVGFNAARDAIQGVGDVSADQVQGQSLLSNLGAYENPYRDQILNPIQADQAAQADRVRAQQSADMARTKAFQGSRAGIREAQTEGELQRARDAGLSPVYQDMFKTSAGLSADDAGRRQSAMISNQGANLTAAQANQQAALQKASLLQGLATARGEAERANLGLQADLGGIKTAQENAAINHPLTYAKETGGLLQGLDASNFTGQTVNTSGTSNMTGTSLEDMTGSGTSKQGGGLLGAIGMGAQIGSMFLSDRRAKTGIRTLGFDEVGRRWVEFAYRWEPLVRRIGVIAQEVLRTDPHAVKRDAASGYLMVDYGALG